MEKQWFETAILTAFLVFTAFAAYQDIKYGSIHVGVFVAGGAVGIFLQTGRLIAAFVRSGIWPFGGGMAFTMQQLLGAAAVGVFLLCVSCITQEAVGEGDGFFFLVAGCYLGFFKTVFLFTGALFLCFPVSAVLLIRQILCGGAGSVKGGRLPFLPFVLPVAVLVLFW